MSVTATDLNIKQEAFAQLYATSQEFFANGVQSYIEVYDPDRSKNGWYKIACQSASQLLSNIKVCKRINELLELRGLNDMFVDKQLELLITQHVDFSSKMKAIAEYNKLKSRITAKTESTITADVTSNGETITDPTLTSNYLEHLKQQTMTPSGD